MHLLRLALVCLFAQACQSFCASIPGTATNYVLVTNVVVVTNYVVTTRIVLTTNAVASGMTNSALPDLSWIPPQDKYDWIQLNTGEWLKGRIKAMQERQIEFFSEKLSDETFDWKDIRQVISPRTLDVLFVNGTKLSGPIKITPDQVTVGGDTPTVFSRNQLQSLTPGGSRERDYWAIDLSLGLTIQTGNTKAVQYNAQVDLQRRTPSTRLSLDYIGNISRINGVESANNHRINSEFDFWLSQQFYIVLPSAEYYKDPFQNVNHRITLGGGIGYDLINRSYLEWNINTGPAYQYAWFLPTQSGVATQKGTLALTFGSRFKWDVTSRIKWILEYRGQYTSREVGETTHHGVSTLSVDLNKRLTLDVSGIWDRISDPKIGADGVEPKPDDFRIVLGFGIHL